MEGYKDYDEIEITVNPYSLDAISPNPASTQVNVSYSAEGASSAYIMLVSTTSGASNNYIVNLNEQSISIDVSTYSNGIYSIVLICDGVAVDSKNLSIIH